MRANSAPAGDDDRAPVRRRLSTRHLAAFVSVAAVTPAVLLAAVPNAEAGGRSKYERDQCASPGTNWPTHATYGRSSKSITAAASAYTNCPNGNASYGWMRAGVVLPNARFETSAELGFASYTRYSIAPANRDEYPFCYHNGYTHSHYISCTSVWF
jgi:hypothetical protein